MFQTGVDDKAASSVDGGTGDAVLVGVGGLGVLDGAREGEGVCLSPSAVLTSGFRFTDGMIFSTCPGND